MPPKMIAKSTIEGRTRDNWSCEQQLTPAQVSSSNGPPATFGVAVFKERLADSVSSSAEPLFDSYERNHEYKLGDEVNSPIQNPKIGENELNKIVLFDFYQSNWYILDVSKKEFNNGQAYVSNELLSGEFGQIVDGEKNRQSKHLKPGFADLLPPEIISTIEEQVSGTGFNRDEWIERVLKFAATLELPDDYGAAGRKLRVKDDPLFQRTVAENQWKTRRQRGLSWGADIFEFVQETYDQWLWPKGNLAFSDFEDLDSPLYERLTSLGRGSFPEGFYLFKDTGSSGVETQRILDPIERLMTYGKQMYLSGQHKTFEHD